jgi:hypothetical protein
MCSSVRRAIREPALVGVSDGVEESGLHAPMARDILGQLVRVEAFDFLVIEHFRSPYDMVCVAYDRSRSA